MLVAGSILLGVLLYLVSSRIRLHYRTLRDRVMSQEQVIAAQARELDERDDELLHERAEQFRLQHALHNAEQLIENAEQAILMTDADNRIVRVNQAFTAITGYTSVEVLGRNPSLLKSGRHGADFYAEMWHALHQLGRWEGDIWNRHQDGRLYVERLSISRTESEPGRGGYLGVFRAIPRHQEAEDLLRYKADHDSLTDLPNRMLFNDRLQVACRQAKRYCRVFALLMINLDHFKAVNDSMGFASGDQLLVEAACRLDNCVRESDTVARVGGDAFAIILSELASDAHAEQVAQRAMQFLAEPYCLDAGTAHISASVGITLYPRHAREAQQMLRNAELALHAAKEGGRGVCCVYAPLQRGGTPQESLL